MTADVGHLWGLFLNRYHEFAAPWEELEHANDEVQRLRQVCSHAMSRESNVVGERDLLADENARLRLELVKRTAA